MGTTKKSSELPSRRAVFLDRDGVINGLIYHKDAGIVDSPATAKQFQIFPKVPAAIRVLNDLGLLVIVVSNQPGIAKGKLDPDTLRSFDRKLHSSLKSAGAHVDAIYYCTHHPDSIIPELRKRCKCRKPGIGMLKQAAREFNVSLSDCYMIGDGLSDIEAGSRAGCQTVFVGRWKCECCSFIRPSGLRPALVAKDLWEAVHLVKAVLRDKRIAQSHPDCANYG